MFDDASEDAVELCVAVNSVVNEWPTEQVHTDDAGESRFCGGDLGCCGATAAEVAGCTTTKCCCCCSRCLPAIGKLRTSGEVAACAQVSVVDVTEAATVVLGSAALLA